MSPGPTRRCPLSNHALLATNTTSGSALNQVRNGPGQFPSRGSQILSSVGIKGLKGRPLQKVSIKYVSKYLRLRSKHSLMLNLQQFNLWAWATYTGTQKVAMLFRFIPPKLDRQYEKAWVLLTFPTYTQLIYSLQSHSRLTQHSVLPVPSPLDTSSFSPPLDDIHCQVYQSPFDKHQMLLCDICNAGWHMDCLFPPLTTSPHAIWKCPLCLPRHLLPQTATHHLHLPSPIVDFDSD